MLTMIWAHENVEEFCRLILEAKERRSQMGAIAAAQMMMQQMGIAQQMMMGQQPMMMGQQPMMMGQQNQLPMSYPSAYSEVELPHANEYPKRYS
jgi:hypothetical protein